MFQSKKIIFLMNLSQQKLAQFSKDDLDKENCRPFSVSKAFERIMLHQINTFTTDKLLKHQTEFRKKKQHTTLFDFYVEMWKKILDQERYICALFIDLLKAFDTLNHDLLISKLGAYGFETDALRYMKSYLITESK